MVENGSPDKGELEEDCYRILRQYCMRKEGRGGQGWDRGLQKERGGQGTVQVRRDSLPATLSEETLIQVA